MLDEPLTGSAADAWREAVARSRNETDKGMTTPPPAWEPEVWEADEQPSARPARKSGRQPRPAARDGSDGATGNRRARAVNPEATKELSRAVGPKRAPHLEDRLADAARAYERDRYQDAAKILRPLAEQAPSAATVRELLGLTLYRMGRWRPAIKELEAFRQLTGSYDQHPTLADSHRALKQWTAADALWADLKSASPGAELVAEGRIVAAGALADRGMLREAVKLLEDANTKVKSPRQHHLRTWYALADLYERAGDVPHARETFRQILRYDASFVDVPERLAALV